MYFPNGINRPDVINPDSTVNSIDGVFGFENAQNNKEKAVFLHYCFFNAV